MNPTSRQNPFSSHIPAAESKATENTRDKLKRRLKEQDAGITPEAFNKAKKVINDWLIRHSDQRVAVPSTPLKERDVVPYDSNVQSKNTTAKTKSEFVLKMRKELTEQFSQDTGNLAKLDGRISGPKSTGAA